LISHSLALSIPGSATPTAATTPTGAHSLTTRLSTQTGIEGALAYLLDCHERATHEERYVSKRGGSATEKKAVLALCRECCVTHSALLLQGYFGPINIPTRSDDRCVCVCMVEIIIDIIYPYLFIALSHSLSLTHSHTCSKLPSYSSLLTPYLLHNWYGCRPLPSGYLADLVVHAHRDSEGLRGEDTPLSMVSY
jgi:hypothetical protein